MLTIISYTYLNFNLNCTNNVFIMYHIYSRTPNVNSGYIIFKVLMECFMYMCVIHLSLLKAR